MRDGSTTTKSSHCLQLKVFATYAKHIIRYDLFTTVETLTPTPPLNVTTKNIMWKLYFKNSS